MEYKQAAASSRNLSKTLDNLGYSYEMIKHRQFKYEESDQLYNRYNADGISANRVTTGGNGEGTTLFFESDTDHMFVIMNVICTSKPEEYTHVKMSTIFETDMTCSSAGYTRLKLARYDGQSFKEEIQDSLFKSEGGSKYISSDFFINTIQKYVQVIMKEKGFHCTSRSGPSTPSANPYVCHDNVAAFACYAEEYMNNWVKRSRRYEWPSAEVIDKSAELEGAVVPVGHKTSENQFREWRICFTKSELLLIRSLNEVQLKVIVLLKRIARHFLKEINTKSITSYIMKNVALWVFEKTPSSEFTEHRLLQLFLNCLKFLKVCFDDDFLPSYMIPQRNLLTERLDKHQKNELSDILKDLMLEKESAVMRIEEIRNTSMKFTLDPEQVSNYSDRRDTMEKLLLKRRSIRAEVLRPKMREQEHLQILSEHLEYNEIKKQLNEMVLPDKHELEKNGADIEDIFVRRISNIVR